MKYMGSKRALLRNGLGDLLIRRVRGASRIVDLFSGSAAVSWFLAKHVDVPILAVDLQEFAAVLARSVLQRTEPRRPDGALAAWLAEADRKRKGSRRMRQAREINAARLTKKAIISSRHLCSRKRSRIGPVWAAYGGYYFSPAQAITFDYLLAGLPAEPEERDLCLAALVIAASRCAAAPGHTAQPFSPTKSAMPHIESSWSRDPISVCREELTHLVRRHSKKKGEARVADALAIASELGPGDLVIVDPPYSNVQYSRYYHVLETIALGRCGEVSGSGRYPALEERPQSAFSRRNDSTGAFAELLWLLGERGCEVVVTFPQFEGSNGLVGEEMVRMAREWFNVNVTSLATRFSTLGGNGVVRAARRRSGEFVMSMHPKH